MNERLVVRHITVTDPTQASNLNDGHKAYFTVPLSETIVYACVAPLANDPGALVDIEDDETAVISSLVASVAATPGTWISTHFGGTQTPVEVVAGSDISFGFTAAANGAVFFVTIYSLVGENHA